MEFRNNWCRFAAPQQSELWSGASSVVPWQKEDGFSWDFDFGNCQTSIFIFVHKCINHQRCSCSAMISIRCFLLQSRCYFAQVSRWFSQRRTSNFRTRSSIRTQTFRTSSTRISCRMWKQRPLESVRGTWFRVQFGLNRIQNYSCSSESSMKQLVEHGWRLCVKIFSTVAGSLQCGPSKKLWLCNMPQIYPLSAETENPPKVSFFPRKTIEAYSTGSPQLFYMFL